MSFIAPKPAASAQTGARSVVTYWRASLVDGARQDLSAQALAPVAGRNDGQYAVPRDVLRQGVVPDDPPGRLRKIFRDAARSAGEDDAERGEAASCRVLVCPFVARAAVTHGARGSREDYVVPLWIPAVLSRDGRLSPPGEGAPWIPRDRLEPGRDDRTVILGSVAAVDRYLSAADPPDASEGWDAYWEHAWKMLQAVGEEAGWKLTHGGFDLGALGLADPGAYLTLPTGFVVPQAAAPAMVAPLMTVYDYVLDADAVPPLLARFAAAAPREQAEPMGAEASVRAHALHLGQMSDRHALAASQRQALHHALSLDEGDVLAINGPPGTGKTTLIQSIVASLWVRAALDEAEPPVIVAVSTNNQAVTNVIESFGKAQQAESPLAGRWVPEVSSFGLFCASKARQDEDAARFQVASERGGPFPTLVENAEYLERARAAFMDHAARAFGRGFPSVADVIRRLHGELAECAATLEEGVRARLALLQVRAAVEKRFGTLALAPLLQAASGEADALDRQLREAREDADRQAAKYRRAHDRAVAEAADRVEMESASWRTLREAWQAFDGGAAWWIVALGWLGPVREHRRALIRRFLSAQGAAPPPEVRDPADVDGWIDAALADVRDRAAEAGGAAARALLHALGGVEAAHAAFREPRATQLADLRGEIRVMQELDSRLRAATAAWDGWTAARSKGARGRDADGGTSGSDDALERADRLLRVRAFQLATHYWEGRWLEEMRQQIESGYQEKKSRFKQEKRWRRYAKLTPCMVSTLYKAPSFFTWWSGEKPGTVPLLSYIDLLIVDEAGQVPPELAGAALALAKRALVVGDVEQLRPVWRVSAWGDAGNLRIAGLAATAEARERVYESGITASAGSAMRVAQRQSPYRIPGLAYGGMLLTEHYRCAPRIIAYSNQLCYDRRLHPVRPDDAEAPALPRMGYAHVRGTSRRIAGSRDNPVEAQAIVRWIAEHVDELRELGAKARGLAEGDERPPLQQVVAVVTPFRAQARAIREGLAKRKINGLTINTVHALQGDERDVVIFSSVYTQEDGGNRPMLEDRALLNVAVSRAKESFLVFGDMGVFDVRSRSAAGLLGKHLMASQENEITDVLALPEGSGDRKPDLSGLEAHRAALRGFFEKAKHIVRIASPWISARAIRDDGIEQLVRDAVARDVQVVCYVDADLNRVDGRDRPAAAVGKRLLAASGATVRVATRIHNKTVTVDDAQISEGSFNWLSAVRRPESPYHRLERTLVYSDGAAPLIQRFLADMEPRVIETIDPTPRPNPPSR